MSVERCQNGPAHCTACDCRWFPYAGGACEVCARNTRVPRRAAKPASRFTRDQLDALTAQARHHKPIPVYKEVPAKEWQDNSRDRWGAPARGPLGKQWAGGNCLRGAVASLLNAPIEKIPDPSLRFNTGGEWFSGYNEELQQRLATGSRGCRRHCARRELTSSGSRISAKPATPIMPSSQETECASTTAPAYTKDGCRSTDSTADSCCGRRHAP
jgi:hypothetical protein